MELKLNTIAPEELPGAAQTIMVLKKEPFRVLWYKGEILVNNRMNGIHKITEEIRNMWKHDTILDDNVSELMDRAYDTIRYLAGDVAADQAFAAWRKAAEVSRRKRGEVEANKWYQEVYQKLNYDTRALINDCGGGDNDFLMGLQEAFFAARKGNEAAFNWSGESVFRAIFTYGFLKGQEVSAAEVAK